MGVQTAHHEKMGVPRRKLNWGKGVPSANLRQLWSTVNGQPDDCRPYFSRAFAMVWSCMLLVPS